VTGNREPQTKTEQFMVSNIQDMGCHTYTSVKNKTEKITQILTKMLSHFGMQ